MAANNRSRPLDWTSLRDFLAVAESGSLSQAARVIGVSQPTLTRRMAALEDRLQAELFHRNPRGLELTEVGEAMLEPARQMQQDAQALEVAVSGHTIDDKVQSDRGFDLCDVPGAVAVVPDQ